VLRRVCRADDIIARWGGDEFVLLLPKTNREEAEKIIERIKAEFSKEQIKAIKCSISMGADTKQKIGDNIIEVLDRAEERMYSVKTLENNEFRSRVIARLLQHSMKTVLGKKTTPIMSVNCARNWAEP